MPEPPAQISVPAPAESHSSPTLPNLPPEILIQITSSLFPASNLASLAQTCRKLNFFMKIHGWVTFVREWFPTQAGELLRQKAWREQHRSRYRDADADADADGGGGGGGGGAKEAMKDWKNDNDSNDNQDIDWALLARRLILLSRDWTMGNVTSADVLCSDDFKATTRPAHSQLLVSSRHGGGGGGGQTMGYRSVAVDCWDDIYGTTLAEGGGGTGERLAIGAGSMLVVRRRGNKEEEGKWNRSLRNGARRWQVYEDPTVKYGHGRNDISAVKLTQVYGCPRGATATERSGRGSSDVDINDERGNGVSEDVLVGRASGELSLLHLPPPPPPGSDNRLLQYRVLQTYETNGEEILSADISPWLESGTSGQDSRLIASLFKTRVAIYPLQSPSNSNGGYRPEYQNSDEDDTPVPTQPPLSINPIFSLMHASELGKATRFLSETSLATSYLSRGALSEPLLSVHEVTPYGGITETTLPKWTLTPEAGSSATQAIYSIVGVPEGRFAGSKLCGAGSIILAGFHNGVVSLYDIRAPSQTPKGLLQFASVACASSHISSLATLGCQRFAAGSSEYGVVVAWDLRAPLQVWSQWGGEGGGENATTNTNPISPDKFKLPAKSDALWGTYLNLRLQKLELSPWQRSRNHQQSQWRRPIITKTQTPVYSLTTGSSFGRRLYAGLEGRVVEVGFGDAAKGEGEKKEEERGAEEEDSILPYLVRFNEGEQGLAVWPNAWGNQPREGVAI